MFDLRRLDAGSKSDSSTIDTSNTDYWYVAAVCGVACGVGSHCERFVHMICRSNEAAESYAFKYMFIEAFRVFLATPVTHFLLFDSLITM